MRWLSKLKWWRQDKSPALLVHDYGQYSYKPVIARAISAVVGVSQAEVCNWIADPEIEIFLNDRLIQGANWARERLESGGYEIKITTPGEAKDKVWRFFIA